MKIRPKKNEKAITLIALVVTIVVLLILAGVSISMLGGENGIITQAKKSKEATEIGEEREYVDLAVQNIMLAKKANNSAAAISEDELQNEMNKTAGIGKTTVSTNEEGKLVVKYIDSNRDYPVEPGDGEVEINWEEILKTATKHPEQSDTNNNIGVGTDGKPVNMDLWRTTAIEDDEIGLDGFVGCYSNTSYIGSITEDGKIQGKVPQYIKLDGESNFRIVTSMYATFIRCNDLKIAPEIPSSVTNMDSTFFQCAGLTTASEIPSNVTNMDSTFVQCTSLTTAVEIPSNVINIGNTFSGCSSLTGDLIINANPSEYSYCLTYASTNEGTNLVLKGTSTKLQEILNTKSSNSNITLGE